MRFIRKIFGTGDSKAKPIAQGGPFATREEALAAAKAEIDKLIAKKGEQK